MANRRIGDDPTLGEPNRTLRFIDLFAGLGGFHEALTQLGHECVYASEIDPDLQALYRLNFPGSNGYLFGDITDPEAKAKIPEHQVLCAGFPCQPFSKSGFQEGWRDQTRGTLFWHVLDILERHLPEYVILENVGNLERHDDGNTWRNIKDNLRRVGYDVLGTEHVENLGAGLLSPHHLGYPHSRERFFIVGRRCDLGGITCDPFPLRDRKRITSLAGVVQPKSELSALDQLETKLTDQQVDCIDHWNTLLKRLPRDQELPSFPIWGDEFWVQYPFEPQTPSAVDLEQLRQAFEGYLDPARLSRAKLLNYLPSYAQLPQRQFPYWKRRFIRQNREWYAANRAAFPKGWVDKLRDFPPSLRKLEWNCKGERRDLWQQVLQFRPSGLRVKRYTSSPSLVAMTETQIPILGPERRFLTRTEGLRLQGFARDMRLGCLSRSRAFRALGNGVHVGVVCAVADRLLGSYQSCGPVEPRLSWQSSFWDAGTSDLDAAVGVATLNEA